jgi:hypothetical protein
MTFPFGVRKLVGVIRKIAEVDGVSPDVNSRHRDATSQHRERQAMGRPVSEAAFWRAICIERVGAEPAAILNDHWVRRLLSEAADHRLNAGVDGFLYRFSDSSRLIVTAGLTKASGQ